MLLSALSRRVHTVSIRVAPMAAVSSNGSPAPSSMFAECTLQDLPKSNMFTTNLPPDPNFKTPSRSFKASQEDLGPRMVRGALYTYVRPEGTENPELLGVSRSALKDIGLKKGEEKTQDFKNLVAGNKILWDPETETGIYPWAQCYGGNIKSRKAIFAKTDSRIRLAIVCQYVMLLLECC